MNRLSDVKLEYFRLVTFFWSGGGGGIETNLYVLLKVRPLLLVNDILHLNIIITAYRFIGL